MKMKKITAILLMGIMLASVALSGCSKSDTSKVSTGTTESVDTSSSDKSEDATTTSSEVTEVTFWTLSGKQESTDKITEAFNAANQDVKVKVSYYDTDAIKDALKIGASAGNLPNMWFNWGGSLGGFYAENGITYDLTQYAEENNWAGKFTPGALELCNFGGQLSGFPTSFNALGVYYRKDIFEQYGLQVPTSFEEFEQVCATLKENGITPISTAGLNGWHVMRVVELFIEHYAGVQMHDKLNNFEISWDNEQVIQALTKYKEFCDKGYFPEGFVTTDPNDTKMPFYSGAAAMILEGQWYDGNIIADEQDMSLYGTFPFPSGESNRLSAFVDMVQFNAKCTEKELDASLRYTDYYNSLENANTYSQFFSHPLPQLNATMPEGQPNVEIIINASNKNGTFTITDQAFPTQIADVLFSVQDAIATGVMTPADGAKAIQAAIDKYHTK